VCEYRVCVWMSRVCLPPHFVCGCCEWVSHSFCVWMSRVCICVWISCVCMNVSCVSPSPFWEACVSLFCVWMLWVCLLPPHRHKIGRHMWGVHVCLSTRCVDVVGVSAILCVNVIRVCLCVCEYRVCVCVCVWMSRVSLSLPPVCVWRSCVSLPPSFACEMCECVSIIFVWMLRVSLPVSCVWLSSGCLSPSLLGLLMCVCHFHVQLVSMLLFWKNLKPHVQPMAFGVSFNLHLQYQCLLSLFNATWRKETQRTRTSIEIWGWKSYTPHDIDCSK